MDALTSRVVCNAISLLQVAASKELSCSQRFTKACFAFEKSYREILGYRKSSPEDHIRSLKQYLSIAHVLCPRSQNLHRSAIRHPDLNPNNILVSESLEISSILD